MFEREFRELSFVPRWPIARLLRRQSVAEHSYYVALYAHQICLTLGEVDTAHIILTAALYHDLEETFTSDTPSPSKRAMVGDNKHRYYEWCSGMLTDRFTDAAGYWWAAKAPEVDAILKVANLMDEVAHLSTDLQMGNRAATPMWDNSYNRLKLAGANLWEFYPKTAHKITSIIDDFCVDHRDRQSQIPLNDDDVNKTRDPEVPF
jgi:5'-deoxynucleotidase